MNAEQVGHDLGREPAGELEQRSPTRIAAVNGDAFHATAEDELADRTRRHRAEEQPLMSPDDARRQLDESGQQLAHIAGVGLADGRVTEPDHAFSPSTMTSSAVSRGTRLTGWAYRGCATSKTQPCKRQPTRSSNNSST